MSIEQLRLEFERVIEKGISKHIGVENSDHWLIEEIDTDLKNKVTSGVLEKIQELECIFDKL